MNPSTTMALLGVGYIGGSVALAARAAGRITRVVGSDPDPAALEIARQRGIIDEGVSRPADAVAEAGVVVLAAPVASLGILAQAIAPALRPDALVIDVGSVKERVVNQVDAALGAGRFVGCHPLAGTERSGPAASDAELFRGRLCLVTPGPGALAEMVAAATAFWEALGAHVLTLAPGPHDAMMAAVSHLPHVAAFALAASLTDTLGALEGQGPAAGPTTSLRDTTRIAASNPRVWRDIFLENRAHLLPLMRALETRVSRLRQAVEEMDGAGLESELAAGRAARSRLMREP